MNNQDTLRQLIQRHREVFDTDAPDAFGWEGLHRALDRLRQSGALETFLLSNRPLLDSTPLSPEVDRAFRKTLDRLQTADPLDVFLLSNRPLLDDAEPAGSVWHHIQQSLDQTKPRDPLERYIQENRDLLDAFEPTPALWNGIEGQLPTASSATDPGLHLTVRWSGTLLRAAAAIALLVTGIGLGLWLGSSAPQSGIALADVSPEYAELQEYYERDIAGKKNKLTLFTGNRGSEVLDDLQQLDQVMEDLRRELGDVPPANREQVVRAMIENYKTKAAILQRVLEQLEKAEPTRKGIQEVDNI